MLPQFIAEIGEKALRFVLVFNVIYAFASAVLAAAGFPVTYSGVAAYQWASYLANFTSVGVSNAMDPVGARTTISMLTFIFAFLFSMATGVVSIATAVAPLIDMAVPGLSGVLITIAIIVQGFVLVYVALKLYIFFRSLLSSIILGG